MQSGAFLAQSDTIRFQAANRPFFRLAELHKRPFLPGNEFLYGRNEAPAEALLLHHSKGIASKTRAFVFFGPVYNSEKTAQCCMEKNCVRAISVV
jgi:hypothetical protein